MADAQHHNRSHAKHCCGVCRGTRTGHGYLCQISQWGGAFGHFPVYMCYETYRDDSLIKSITKNLRRYGLSLRADNHILSFGLGGWYD